MAARKNKPTEPEVVSGVAEAESLEQKVVLTVNGKPVPEEWAHLIDYKMTDQGQAEARAKADETGRPRVQVTADAWDKTLQRKGEAEVWDSFDPLKEAVDQVRQPGMSYRFVSDRVLKRRGRRGWEPVTDKDGKPVEVAGMKLGAMPKASAERRNAHYQELANEQLRAAAENYELEQAKAIRDANVSGFAPLRAGDMVADNHAHPGKIAPVGVERGRGTGAGVE